MEQLYDIIFFDGKAPIRENTLAEIEAWIEENGYILEDNAQRWGVDSVIEGAESAGVYDDPNDEYGVAKITWHKGLQWRSDVEIAKEYERKHEIMIYNDTPDDEIQRITGLAYDSVDHDKVIIGGGKDAIYDYFAKQRKPDGTLEVRPDHGPAQHIVAEMKIVKISKETYEKNAQWLKIHPELSLGCYILEHDDGDLDISLHRIADIKSDSGRYVPGWSEVEYPKYLQDLLYIPAFILKDAKETTIRLEWI